MKRRAGLPDAAAGVDMRNNWLMAGTLLALLTLPACSRIKAQQGFLLDETLATSIQPGVDNRESVSRTMGRPSFASEFDNGTWYYVTRLTGQYAFSRPKTLQQNILIVRFNEKGVVAKVERRGLDQIADISPVKDKTPTLGAKESFLNELFGNIGQVGAAGLGPNGSGPTGRDGPRQ
jgi:outer membrane protein assembly factor BamE (lipoprotein component of BamABCDE complex)